jgi:hypothetical protein
MALVVFFCISAAECLLIWGRGEAIPAALILLLMSLALGITAAVEARKLSAKNIERTKAAVQKSMDDATSKLNLPV